MTYLPINILLSGELKEQGDKIIEMSTWCDAENITYPPTIFINGHGLTWEYSVKGSFRGNYIDKNGPKKTLGHRRYSFAKNGHKPWVSLTVQGKYKS